MAKPPKKTEVFTPGQHPNTQTGVGIVTTAAAAIARYFEINVPLGVLLVILAFGLVLSLHGIVHYTWATRFRKFFWPTAAFIAGVLVTLLILISPLAPQTLAQKLDRVARDATGGKFPPGPITHLLRISDRHFKNETVRLDGREFVRCVFENVTILYDGGPYRLIDARFTIGDGNEMRISTANQSINNFMKFWNTIQKDKFEVIDVPSNTITGEAPFP